MKNMTFKRIMLLTVLLAVTLSAVTGGTIAWFTDEVTSAQNTIQTGNLDLEVYLNEAKDGNEVTKDTPVFSMPTLWEPGAVAYAKLILKNEGSLSFKYRMNVDITKENHIKVEEAYKLSDVLKLAFVTEEVNINDRTAVLNAAKKTGTAFEDFSVTGQLYAENSKDDEGNALTSESSGLLVAYWEPGANDNNWNVFNGKETSDGKALRIDLGLNIAATQYTFEEDSFDKQYDASAALPGDWDGTADTSWYNDTDTEFTLSAPQQLAGLSELVDGGNTFEGKTIKLSGNVNLYAKGANGEPICFNPIGSYRNDTAFKGTFDGQGHTISNMSQNTWALNNGYSYSDLGLGLFGKVKDATIKALVMDGASISGESAICGTVAATAYGNCTFEDITVTNSQINDYQYYAGGVVGWASGDHVYKNINIDESVTIGSQWGDFGNASGGIIGGTGSSAKIHLKDCAVACRIDAVNDIVSAYQWYCYRNCGMLIGKTGHTIDDGENTSDNVGHATAPNLTCENVTVIYGDWANYTYCEFAGTGYPYVRVQAGVSVDAYSNVRYGHPKDANGNTVVDDNHVHHDGEDHHKLIVFDQLYGGSADHRYCYYGVAAHDGVNVIYNNK